MGSGADGLAPLHLLLVVSVLGLALLLPWPELWRKPVVREAAGKRPRPLKPKTGADCPLCQLEQGAVVNEGNAAALPRPWREGRSRRRRKKRSVTAGYACDNMACTYYGISDAAIHALVADGHHGKYEAIQDLKCQACGHKFTVRRHTVLYCLKTHSTRVAEFLTFLAEGVDASELERIWQIGEGTLRTLLTRAGLHAKKVYEHFFRGLRFEHIQLDELWANVRRESQEVWVWVAMEATTKMVPVIQLGPRTLDMAYAVVHELRTRMQVGSALPVFSSDGLRLYFHALTAHLGYWLVPDGGRKRLWQLAADFIYAQVKKLQRRRRLVKVERIMLCGSFEALASRLKAAGLSGRLNTAFVERLNLTLRQGVALLTRRTWGAAEQTSELALDVPWWRAYYHFARYHEALRVEQVASQPRRGNRAARRYRSQTPAMAAGLTSRRGTVLELIGCPMYSGGGRRNRCQSADSCLAFLSFPAAFLLQMASVTVPCPRHDLTYPPELSTTDIASTRVFGCPCVAYILVHLGRGCERAVGGGILRRRQGVAAGRQQPERQQNTEREETLHHVDFSSSIRSIRQTQKPRQRRRAACQPCNCRQAFKQAVYSWDSGCSAMLLLFPGLGSRSSAAIAPLDVS